MRRSKDFMYRVVRYRVDVAQRRLDDACASNDAVIVNAAAAEYLDAVYSARELVWGQTVLHSNYAELESNDRDGQVVAGLVWARNNATHGWVAPGALEPIYEDSYSDRYGTWCWAIELSGREPSHARYYTSTLGGRPVRSAFEPAARWLFITLPHAFPGIYDRLSGL